MVSRSPWRNTNSLLFSKRKVVCEGCGVIVMRAPHRNKHDHNYCSMPCANRSRAGKKYKSRRKATNV